MTNIAKLKNNSLGFPVSYADNPDNDGNRLSDKFLIVVQSKKFKDISSALFSLVFFLGHQSQPANAIPPEAGGPVYDASEAAVNAGRAASLVPEGTRAATCAADSPRPAPLPELAQSIPFGAGNGGGAGGPVPGPGPGPGNPPIYIPLGQPRTPVTRGINTFVFAGSVVGICLNAYWGNSIAIVGCAGMIVAWLGEHLGIKINFTR